MDEPAPKKFKRLPDVEDGEILSESEDQSDMEDGELLDSDEEMAEKLKNSKSSTPKKSPQAKMDSQYTKGVILIRQGDQKLNSPILLTSPILLRVLDYFFENLVF